MYVNTEIVQYFHQLDVYLHTQSRQMAEMNKLIQQLQQDIRQLKGNMSPPVIKNEYKFDLLKIEKLDGTLNIGLNPKGSDSSIDEFSVDQSMDVPSETKQGTNLFPRIQQQINQYLNDEAIPVLVSIEQKYDFSLDEPYRNFILEDVKKQIDQRIHYYLNQYKPDELDSEQIAYIEKSTTQQVKNDIENTFEAFIKNLPKGR